MTSLFQKNYCSTQSERVTLGTLSLYLFVFHVLLKVHILINGAFGCYLYHAVAHGVDKLMVVRSHDDVARIGLHIVVECLYRLHIQVVGWVVEHNNVGVREHHFGYHATHLLTTRKHCTFFLYIIAREEHFAQIGAQEVVFSVG